VGRREGWGSTAGIGWGEGCASPPPAGKKVLLSHPAQGRTAGTSALQGGVGAEPPSRNLIKNRGCPLMLNLNTKQVWKLPGMQQFRNDRRKGPKNVSGRSTYRNTYFPPSSRGPPSDPSPAPTERGRWGSNGPGRAAAATGRWRTALRCRKRRARRKGPGPVAGTCTHTAPYRRGGDPPRSPGKYDLPF